MIDEAGPVAEGPPSGGSEPLNPNWNLFVTELFRRAEPYLEMRGDLLHTRVAHRYALILLGKEGGDRAVVEPAVILHDVGWSRLKPDEIRAAYGVLARGERAARLNRVHEVEGAAIARKILEETGYDPALIEKITLIIERHDSGKHPGSLEERIVKDADRLWRFSREGYYHEMERQNLSHQVRHDFLVKHMDNWFFTGTGMDLARAELGDRVEERARGSRS